MVTNTAVSTERAPAAIGPYSQGIRAGAMVFCSGQVGLDPKTGELVGGGVEAQTRQVLANLTAVLAAAGAGLDNVVKTTVYLTDLDDFQRMNAIYGEHFPGVAPARATVQVSRLPKGAQVEIDAIAVTRDAEKIP
jgi:2-iminobutanoate/2-iminopropanoate deaminase